MSQPSATVLNGNKSSDLRINAWVEGGEELTMNHVPSTIVIVDPYSAGSGFAELFHERNVRTIAVLTSAVPPAAMRATWQPADFAAVHVFSGDLDILVHALLPQKPLAVIPGAETGVELADALAARIRPELANVAELSTARRDKWQMAQAVQAAGLPGLRQICTADPAEAREWISTEGLADEPLVVKPPKSFGTDDVHLIWPGQDWYASFMGILGRQNIGGQPNEAVLVQEYARGVEYIVDTYSADGDHGLVDVCRYTKSTRQGRTGIYDRVDFLPPDDPVVEPLFAFTRRVLNALGVRNGSGHTEIMLTAAGPRLLEVGARPAGALHQILTRLATGECHLDRTVAHLLDGVFRTDYELLQHVRIAFLSAPMAGVWVNPEIFAELDTLSTIHTWHVSASSGDFVPETVDLFSTIGHVIFVAEDESPLDADYQIVKKLESLVKIVPAEGKDMRLIDNDGMG